MRMRNLAPLWAVLMSTVLLGGCELFKNENDNDNENTNKNTQIVNIFTGPSGIFECSDNQNNDPWEDNLKDIEDPGCHTDGNANNPRSYNPSDNDERDNPPSPPPTSPPPTSPTPPTTPTGTFHHTGPVTCTLTTPGPGERTIAFGWTVLAGVTTWRVEEKFRRPNSLVFEVGETQMVNVPMVTWTRRRTAFVYTYRVFAVHSGGEILWANGDWTAPCDVMQDPAPPPVITTPPPPTSPLPPELPPVVPPIGPTCTSGQNYTPFGGSGRVGTTFQLFPTVSACPVIRFTTNAPDNVPVSSSGVGRYLNVGESACIQLNGALCGTFTSLP